MDVLEGVVRVIGHAMGARDEALGRRVVIVHDHIHACDIENIPHLEFKEMDNSSVT